MSNKIRLAQCILLSVRIVHWHARNGHYHQTHNSSNIFFTALNRIYSARSLKISLTKHRKNCYNVKSIYIESRTYFWMLWLQTIMLIYLLLLWQHFPNNFTNKMRQKNIIFPIWIIKSHFPSICSESFQIEYNRIDDDHWTIF